MYYLTDLSDEQVYEGKTKDEIEKIILGWISDGSTVDDIEEEIGRGTIMLIQGKEIKFKIINSDIKVAF